MDSTTSDQMAGAGDASPGYDRTLEETPRAGLRRYLAGFALAGLLTAAAFLIAATDLIYGPSVPVALLVLAVAQMGVHLVFFLHITSAPDNTNNVLALAFGMLIVFLVVGGSLWIMSHLDRNMLPMDPMRQMNTAM